MKKHLLFFVLVVVFQNKTLAQQDPYFSTYFINPSVINTSLSALNDNNNIVLIYRNQWTNYQPTNLSSTSDSPTTGILSLNLKSRDKIYSFGVNLISDNLGPKEFFSFSPYFGIKKKINNSFFSISISPTFKSTTMNFGSLIFVNPADPFNVGGKQTESKPDLGAGISYFNNKLLLSVGVKNIIQPSFNFGIDDLNNKDFTNLTFLGKYTIQIDRDLSVEPYVLFISDMTSYTFDVSALAIYKENMFIGASYRYDEAVVGFLGYNFL